MRLFTAITIPKKVKNKLLALKKLIDGLKWQDKSQMHLTLRFIGEVDERTAATVTDELREIEFPAFEITLSDIGTFPKRGTPKVIWVGIKENSALNELQSQIEQACQKAGLEADERSYKPHITLARNKGANKEELRSYLENLTVPDFEAIKVTDFCLFRSELTSQGAIHHVERKYDLN